jgi:hypothetical protein
LRGEERKSSREKEKDDTLDPDFDARSSGVSKMNSRKAGSRRSFLEKFVKSRAPLPARAET